jgi:hypothetical protein
MKRAAVMAMVLILVTAFAGAKREQQDRSHDAGTVTGAVAMDRVSAIQVP